MSDARSSSAAGPNGLAAAIRLAEAGRRVAVLEAADAPGGAVRTEELTLPGFRHDTFSSVYPAAAASPVFAPDAAGRARPGVGASRRRATPTRCPAAAASRCTATWTGPPRRSTRVTPATAQRWAGVRRAVPGALRRACARRCSPASRPSAARCKLLARRRARRRCSNFARLLPASSVGLGKRLFGGGGSRAWLYGAAMHGDTPPHRRRLRDRRLLPEPAGPRRRLAEPARRRAGGWPTRSSPTCAALGGEVRTGAPCRRGSSSPAGASPASRSRRRATSRADSSIADVMPHALRRGWPATRCAGWYRSLLHALRLRAGDDQGRLGARRPDPVGDAGGRRRRHRARRRRRGRAAGDDRAAPSDGLPEHPFLLLGQQTRRRPDARAGGQAHRLGLHARPAAGRRLGGRDRRATSSAWRRRSSASRPGFRDRILARHVHRPRRRCRRATRNLVGGDVGGGSYSCARSSSARCRRSRPTARRSRACSWAAPRRSPAARCTACRATPRRAPRCAAGRSPVRRRPLAGPVPQASSPPWAWRSGVRSVVAGPRHPGGSRTKNRGGPGHHTTAAAPAFDSGRPSHVGPRLATVAADFAADRPRNRRRVGRRCAADTGAAAGAGRGALRHVGALGAIAGAAEHLQVLDRARRRRTPRG